MNVGTDRSGRTPACPTCGRIFIEILDAPSVTILGFRRGRWRPSRHEVPEGPPSHREFAEATAKAAPEVARLPAVDAYLQSLERRVGQTLSPQSLFPRWPEGTHGYPPPGRLIPGSPRGPVSEWVLALPVRWHRAALRGTVDVRLEFRDGLSTVMYSPFGTLGRIEIQAHLRGRRSRSGRGARHAEAR